MGKTYDIRVNIDNSQAQQANQQLSQSNRRVLTEAEISAKAQERIIARANKQRIDAATRAAAAEKAGFSESTEGAMGLARGIGSAVLSFGGFASAHAIFSKVVGAMQEAREEGERIAKSLLDMRDRLRELGALKGGGGGDTKTLAAELKRRKETFQTADESRAFGTTFEGAVEAAIGRTIDREEADKFSKFAGRFQASEGSDAEAHAKMAATIPLMSDKKITADEANRRLIQAYNISRPSKMRFGQFADEFAKVQSMVTGGYFQNPQEAMAVLSMFGLDAPGEAGTRTEQLARATVGGLVKGKGNPEMVEKVSPYLKRLLGAKGIKPEAARTVQLAELISDDISRAEAAAKAKGEAFNPAYYIGKHGYGSQQQETMALLQFHRNRKTYKSTFLPPALQMPTTAEANEQADKITTTNLGLERQQELRKDVSDFNRKAGGGEALASLRKGVKAQLEDDKVFDGPIGEMMRWGRGEQRITDDTIGQMLRRRAKQGGFYGREVEENIGLIQSPVAGEQQKSDAVGRLQGVFAEHGQKLGASLEKASDKMEKVAERLAAIEQNLARANGQAKAPAPLPARPMAGAMRP